MGNPSDDRIVVVSGLPRSGTSLMMQILERAGLSILSDGVREADPSNPRGYFELEAVKATHRDASWVEAAPGHAVKVIHAHLPHLPRNRRYRVILMERDLDQVVASQDRMLELREAPAAPNAPAARNAPTPDRIGRVFESQLDACRELLERESCFEWIRVDYAGLVGDPVPRIAPVLAFVESAASAETVAEAVEPALQRNQN